MHLILKGFGAFIFAIGSLTALADLIGVWWENSHLIPGALYGFNGLITGLVLVALGTILKRLPAS